MPAPRRWIGRFFALDPGLTGLRRAARATLSVICAVFSVKFLLQGIGMGTGVTAPLLAGMMGMISSFAVRDPSPRQQQVTMLLMAVTATCGVFVGTALANSQVWENIVLLAIIFIAYYVRRFGPRFLALGMVSFISFYFASLIHTALQQMPWLIIAIAIGICWAFVFMFFLLPDDPRRVLQRTVQACYARAALALDQVRGIVEGRDLGRWSRRRLQRNLAALIDCAAAIQEQLSGDSVDPDALDLHADDMRVYLFDLVLSIQTIAAAAGAIAAERVALPPPVEQALLHLLRALRDACSAATPNSLQDVVPALDALERAAPDGAEPWHYPVRRMLAAGRLLVEEARDGSRPARAATGAEHGAAADRRDAPAEEQPAHEHQRDDGGTPDEGPRTLRERLQPTTIQAFQALGAGALGIVLGYVLSPAHQYWTVLAAFVVLNNADSIGKAYNRALLRVGGTLLGAVVGFGVAFVVAGDMPLEIILAFVAIFLAYYLFSLSYGFLVFWVTIVLSLMYGVLLGSITAGLLESRVIDTLIGAAVAILMSMLILPVRTADQVRSGTGDFLRTLGDYVGRYLDRLMGEEDDRDLIDDAYELGKKLQQVRSLAGIMRQGTLGRTRRGAERLVAALMILYYYAGHLTGPRARSQSLDLDQELRGLLRQVKDGVMANIDALVNIAERTGSARVQDLADLEQRIARRFDRPSAAPAPSSPAPAGAERPHDPQRGDLPRSLHYIWRINQAIIALVREYSPRSGEG